MQPKIKKKIHTQKRKSNPNTTLKMVIKPQEKRKKREGRKNLCKNKHKTIKKMAIGTYIFTLTANGVNAPTKRHRLANGHKNKTHIYAVYKRPTSELGTHRLKVRGWKKILHASGNLKKAGIAIFISEKIDFKIKTVIKDKERHYIMIKRSIQEEYITIVNIYAPNLGAPQYTRQILTAIKGEIDSNTVIVGDFSTPLSSMDRSSRQKINKETQALNDTLDQMDLIDIYRAFHPKAAEYTSYQVHMEHSPVLTTCWVKKRASINLRKLKSYQASFLTAIL